MQIKSPQSIESYVTFSGFLDTRYTQAYLQYEDSSMVYRGFRYGSSLRHLLSASSYGVFLDTFLEDDSIKW